MAGTQVPGTRLRQAGMALIAALCVASVCVASTVAAVFVLSSEVSGRQTDPLIAASPLVLVAYFGIAAWFGRIALTSLRAGTRSGLAVVSLAAKLTPVVVLWGLAWFSTDVETTLGVSPAHIFYLTLLLAVGVSILTDPRLKRRSRRI